MTFDDYYDACAAHLEAGGVLDVAHAHAILMLIGRPALASKAWRYCWHPAGKHLVDGGGHPMTMLLHWFGYVSATWDQVPEGAGPEWIEWSA